jgi:hypothetical protein
MWFTAVVSRAKECLPFKSYSTTSTFWVPKYAEFIAAAGSVDSIPKLHGLPEVSDIQGFCNASIHPDYCKVIVIGTYHLT